jgi:hypothetical protein
LEDGPSGWPKWRGRRRRFVRDWPPISFLAMAVGALVLQLMIVKQVQAPTTRTLLDPESRPGFLNHAHRKVGILAVIFPQPATLRHGGFCITLLLCLLMYAFPAIAAAQDLMGGEEKIGGQGSLSANDREIVSNSTITL